MSPALCPGSWGRGRGVRVVGAGRERPCPLTGHTLPRTPALVSGWPDLDLRDHTVNEVAGPALTRGGQLGVQVAVFILGKRLCALNPAPSRRPLRPATGPPEPGPSPRSFCLCVRRALVLVEPLHPPGIGPEPRRTHFLLDGALGSGRDLCPVAGTRGGGQGPAGAAGGLRPWGSGGQVSWACRLGGRGMGSSRIRGWTGRAASKGGRVYPQDDERGLFSAGAAGRPTGADRQGTGPSPAGGAAGSSFAMSPRPAVAQPRVQCVGPGKCVCRLLVKRGTR